jgi:hypothetical protein
MSQQPPLSAGQHAPTSPLDGKHWKPPGHDALSLMLQVNEHRLPS